MFIFWILAVLWPPDCVCGKVRRKQKRECRADEDEIILDLDDDELVQQMHDDLYDGVQEEIVRVSNSV